MYGCSRELVSLKLCQAALQLSDRSAVSNALSLDLCCCRLCSRLSIAVDPHACCPSNYIYRPCLSVWQLSAESIIMCNPRRMVKLWLTTELHDVRLGWLWTSLVWRQVVILCMPFLSTLRLVNVDGLRAELATTQVADDRPRFSWTLVVSFSITIVTSVLQQKTKT